jgi:hypothetical protein
VLSFRFFGISSTAGKKDGCYEDKTEKAYLIDKTAALAFHYVTPSVVTACIVIGGIMLFQVLKNTGGQLPDVPTT